MRKKKKCNITVYLPLKTKAILVAEAGRAGIPVTAVVRSIIDKQAKKWAGGLE